ncbi:decapping endonuclease targeting mRNA [Diplodia intermedia]|uniref:Decapping endonuclease targeting mRNA n=1 Tax=Diplodia intermedia TaxID=856260 RepID=A0ABR3TMW0_9PEZI
MRTASPGISDNTQQLEALNEQVGHAPTPSRPANSGLPTAACVRIPDKSIQSQIIHNHGYPQGAPKLSMGFGTTSSHNTQPVARTRRVIERRLHHWRDHFGDLESGDEQHVQKMVEGAKHHNYVELKTTEWIDVDRLRDPKKIQQKLNNYDRRKIRSSRLLRVATCELNNYDRRKIKYCGQSYPLGRPTIIVGKKDENGQVHMPLEVLKTNNIPATIRKTSRLWNSVTCVQALGAFLE